MNVYDLANHPRYERQHQMITRQQLMNLWSIKSVNTIKSYVRKGMPEVRLPGGQPRYDEAACREWLQKDSK